MVDLTLSRIDRPKGTVLRKTDILCDYCGVDYFVVETPGSETPTWLRCYNCDQYYYVIRKILCVNVLMVTRGPVAQFRRSVDVQKSLDKETVMRELGK